MYKVISLFSGAGGSTTGYKLAGYDVVASVEFIDYLANNYRLNNPNTKVYEADIRTLNPSKIIKDLGIKKGELDILDGSPPCSSFSMAGKREALWGKEKKYSNTKQRTDDLFFEYIRFLDAIQPKVFVAENVKGLVMGSAKGYFKEIIEGLSACGYTVKAKVLNAKYYNVPQNRERVIFIGVRNDLGIAPSFPIANKEITTIKKAWEGVENKTFNKDLSQAVLDNYRLTGQGESLACGNKRLGEQGNYFTHKRLAFNSISGCVLQTLASGIYHPTEERYITIEELKRIMTFPDTYKLEGTFANKWESCGRAVPPNMMKAISENIEKNIL